MQPSESTYQLPPFPAFPATSRYIPLGSLREALARVCRSIDANEGLSLVIGPPGTGKSLLAGLLAQHYRASHDVVVLGEARMEDPQAFLRNLLHQLRVDLSNLRDCDLQFAVKDQVCREDAPEAGLLIIVDEAQSLSPEVLESIRMVTNIMHQGIPRVSAVICGGTKLDDLLVEASMESFTQRIATRCYLHPLNGDETRQYIRETIQQCGADPDGTISDQAIGTIYHACSGVPRLINQLMTQAIDCAEEADQTMISESIIDLAWSQLQQLPSPMVEEPRLTSRASEVEFGELDEVVSEPADTSSQEVADAIASTHGESSVQEEQVPALLAETGPELDFDEEPEVDGDVLEQDANTVEAASYEIVYEEIDDRPMPGDRGVRRDGPVFDESVFGDFDDEEEILLGADIVRTPKPGSETPLDLESVLHHEIVGLNQYLSEAISSERDFDDEIDCMESIDDETFGTSEPEEVVEEFVNVPDDATNVEVMRSETENASQVCQDEAQAEAEEVSDLPQGGCSIVSIAPELQDTAEAVDEVTGKRDDSDLLVIEDEVEVRRIDAAKRFDAREKTISVDFQTMLSRMRSGSNRA